MTSTGATVREAGSSIKNKTGSWRTFKPVLDKDKCVNCENCLLFCPEGCITKDININYDYCKGCGICANECPVKAIKMERE